MMVSLMIFTSMLGFSTISHTESERVAVSLVADKYKTSYGVHQTRQQCEPCVCYRAKADDLVANCTGRNLTTVPSLPNNINVLRLDFNHLSTLTSGCFSKYVNLTVLNLAFNVITKMENGSFRNLSYLQSLNLAGNKLKYMDSVFEYGIFKPLKNLNILKLNNNNNILKSENSLRYPDKAISELLSLEHLYLDGLTNQSFGEGFSNLSSLTHLSLAGQEGNCSIQFLFNTTFINMKYLRRLNLSHCDLRYIDLDTFSPLKSSLDVLDLSYNTQLKFCNFGIGSFGLQNSTLRILNISAIVGIYDRCVVITKVDLEYLNNTKVQEIYADDNAIEYVEHGALKYLPTSLTKISLENTKLMFGRYITDLKFVSGLREIYLSGEKHAGSVPSPDLVFLTANYEEDVFSGASCSKSASNKITSKQNTKKLRNMDEDSSLCKPPVWCLPPNLTNLTYTFSQLWYNITQVIVGPNSLTHVDFSYNILAFWNGPITGLDKIIYLNLSNNLASQIHPDFFQTLTSLQTLDISNNNIYKSLIDDEEGRLFRNMTSLQFIHLNQNNIHLLPPLVFQGFQNLIFLNLSFNGLYKAPIRLRHLKNLHLIDLSRNQLRYLTKQVTSDLDSIAETQNHSVTIDLSQNPLKCECVNLPFLKWLTNSKVKHVNKELYLCLDAESNPINITDFENVIAMLDNRCANYFGLAVGSFVSVLTFLTIFIVGVMYRFRWKLRYWYFGAMNHFKHFQNKPESRTNFQFDAFISYAEGDENFVHREMITMVEKRRGKKLIIHKRDFLPGHPIASNIVKSVKESRKTVLVLSRHFLRSEWCEYEMQMALHESVHTGRDVLLVLMLDRIPSRYIPHEILNLIQNDSYIEYIPEENTEIFWQRFVTAIETE